MATRSAVKEYKVRIADPQQKVFNIMRFKHPHKCEIDKLIDPVMHRQEVHEKEETEEEAKKREEWRKKRKYRPRRQNPDDQPWVLREKKKDGAVFYGRKEGGVNTSSAYYILKFGQDGDFEALPVNNWYDFVPPVKYNYLNDQEAEERFEKRNKTLNYFSIMVSKRIKESEGVVEEDDNKGKRAGPSGGLRSEDSDNDGFSSSGSDDDGPAKVKKKGGSGSVSADGSGKRKGKGQKKARPVSIDMEAEEESDEGDFESKEVDYFSSSSSDDDVERIKAVREEPRDDAEVERKEEEDIDKVFVESSSDEEDEELTESGKELKALIKKVEGESEPEGPPSDDDEEMMDDSKMDTSKLNESFSDTKELSKSEEDRSAGAVLPPPPAAKKAKLVESSSTISPDEVKKYLTRKPMTSKALVKKFVKQKTDLDKGQIVNILGQLLKSMPQIEKQKIKGKMYLSISAEDT